MAKSDDKKVNKTYSRLAKDIVPIVIVLLLIAVYIFTEIYGATHVEVETVTAVTSTVYQTIDTKALVVRDEHIIDSEKSGVTVACVDDGEKVKQGGNVAMVFNSQESAQSYSSALALQAQLDYYIDIESRAAGTATDVESIDKDILSDVNDYIRQSALYTSGSLEDSSMSLNDKLTRRQIIIGEKIDFSAVKTSLQEQINALNVESCKPVGYVNTDESGVFSSYTDGCESLVDYSKVNQLDVKAFDDALAQAQKAEKTSHLGKMITTYEWYFCCKVDASQIKGIKNGDRLSVAIKDSDDVIDCTVVSGADVDLGVDETILVLRNSTMNGEVASMRAEDIEIRYNSYTGFKVPPAAVHVDSDGNKMVYALTANQVKARYGEIIYSTKDFVIFAYDPENSDGIRLYDQIITQGKDLHDGKIYT
ncbi:MAG: HlyD family efflux transporter periplasmic adaptor subunit [Eubacteriales bacterium]|nr:HlyD family efflux transporter periplasmic adaptor subunit [Eubacteriales bacterium]